MHWKSIGAGVGVLFLLIGGIDSTWNLLERLGLTNIPNLPLAEWFDVVRVIALPVGFALLLAIYRSQRAEIANLRRLVATGPPPEPPPEPSRWLPEATDFSTFAMSHDDMDNLFARAREKARALLAPDAEATLEEIRVAPDPSALFLIWSQVADRWTWLRITEREELTSPVVSWTERTGYGAFP